MTKQQVMDQYRELFSFTDRFGTKATEDVIAAGADIQKALGAGAQSAFVGVMRNIEAMGGLNTRTVRQLREVGIATPQRLYEALAEQLHTNAKGAERMLKAGKISQETSINTLLKLVQDRVDKGGALGEFSKERTLGNIDDQVKNLRESMEGLFQEIDTGPIARSIAGLTEKFDPASASGQRMREDLQKAFNGISGAIDYAGSHMEGWIYKAERAYEIAKKLMAIPMAIFNVGEKAGYLAAKTVAYVSGEDMPKQSEKKAAAAQADIERMNAQIDALSKATADKVESNTMLESAMRKSGIDAGSGFVEGLARSLESGKVPDVIHQYVTAEVDRALDAHSPSRVMMTRGRWAAEGLGIGFRDTMRGGGMFGMGSMPMGGGGFSGSGGGLGGGTLHVDVSGTIRVEGAVTGEPQALAAIGGQFEEIANRAIQRAFESLGHAN